MPRLTMDELTGWIDEFHSSEQVDAAAPQAVDTSWDETTVDTGLVVLRLETSGTEVYLRRKIGGSPSGRSRSRPASTLPRRRPRRSRRWRPR